MVRVRASVCEWVSMNIFVRVKCVHVQIIFSVIQCSCLFHCQLFHSNRMLQSLFSDTIQYAFAAHAFAHPTQKDHEQQIILNEKVKWNTPNRFEWESISSIFSPAFTHVPICWYGSRYMLPLAIHACVCVSVYVHLQSIVKRSCGTTLSPAWTTPATTTYSGGECAFYSMVLYVLYICVCTMYIDLQHLPLYIEWMQFNWIV